MDGVRYDLTGPETAPCVWALGRAGFLAPVPVDEATPTWSGPCWATIATGTGVAGHGITGNDLTGHRLADHPDFVTVATRAGLPTLLAVSGWPPLARPEDGGPLFAEASTREFAAVPETGLAWDAAGEAGLAAWDAADEAITGRAAAILAEEAPRVSFVYLGAVDYTGHAHRLRSRLPGRSEGRRPAGRAARGGGPLPAVRPGGELDDRGGHRPRAPGRGRARRPRARGRHRVGGRGRPGIVPGDPPLITRQEQVAPLVLAAAGCPAHRG